MKTFQDGNCIFLVTNIVFSGYIMILQTDNINKLLEKLNKTNITDFNVVYIHYYMDSVELLNVLKIMLGGHRYKEKDLYKISVEECIESIRTLIMNNNVNNYRKVLSYRENGVIIEKTIVKCEKEVQTDSFIIYSGNISVRLIILVIIDYFKNIFDYLKLKIQLKK
jgi:hypothetical protein